jgi:hypothetical protein
MTSRCVKCGTRNPEGVVECLYCGERLAADGLPPGSSNMATGRRAASRPQRSELNRPMAVALGIITLTAVLKVMLRTPSSWVGDWAFAVGPAIIALAGIRLLVLRKWRQGSGAVVVLVPIVVCAAGLAWLISGVANLFLVRAHQQPQWHRVEQKLSEGMGSLTISLLR